MKILVISYLFAPMNIIGAVRPTKVVDGLTKRGYTIDVAMGKDNSIKMDGIPVPDGINRLYEVEKSGIFKTVLDLLAPLKKAKSAADNSSANTGTPSQSNGIKGRIRGILSQMIYHFGFLAFLNGFKKAWKKGEISHDYDVVYTSYGPLSSLLCGMYVKKKLPSVKWICEFRDPVVTDVLVKEFRRYYGYIQKKACCISDEIIAVSNGYVERICGEEYGEKTHMIPNGYDLNDKPVASEATVSEKFNFTYVGVLYLGKRDLSPLFLAVKELIDEKKIEKEKIAFNYAGLESNVALAQASKYGLDDIIVNHGVLNRKDCLDLQMKSHFLVLATWNDKNEYGVFPGKVLEYMLIGKPIISLTCGDLPGGEVTRVIKEGAFGVAYEEVTHAQDMASLKEYLGKTYNAWCESGKIGFSPRKDVLDRYNYDNIIDQIEALIK